MSRDSDNLTAKTLRLNQRPAVAYLTPRPQKVTTMKQLFVCLSVVACIDSSAQTNLQPPTHSGGLISDGTTFIAADDFLFTNMTKISGVTWWGQSNSLSGAGNFEIAVLSEFLGMAGPAVVFY